MLSRAPKRVRTTNTDSVAQGLVSAGLLILVIGVLGALCKAILGLIIPALIVGGVAAFVFFVVIPILNHEINPSVPPVSPVDPPKSEPVPTTKALTVRQ